MCSPLTSLIRSAVATDVTLALIDRPKEQLRWFAKSLKRHRLSGRADPHVDAIAPGEFLLKSSKNERKKMSTKFPPLESAEDPIPIPTVA